MRKFLIAVLLAGAAATPALAQDWNDHGHHHNQQNDGDAHPRAPRGDDHASRQQFTPPPEMPHQQAPQFAHQPPIIMQQGGRGDRPEFSHPPEMPQQQARQFAHQPPVIVQQGGHGDRPQFSRPPEMPQQGYGYNGYRGGFDRRVQQPEQVRNEDWNRHNGYYGQRGNWNGQNGYYDHGQLVQPQVRDGSRWAGGGWNRDWRNDRRYDWRRYRDEHRSIFRIGIYYDPFGYGYRPYDIGYQLMPVYYGQQYWLDPTMYDLPFPPPGTAWVRYWNDALLVDLYSGQVIDVIHGFFW